MKEIMEYVVRQECIECGTAFMGANNRKRCDKCQEKHRKEYKLQHQKETQPKSARMNSLYWQWYQAMKDLSKSEIQYMFKKKKEEMKALSKWEKNSPDYSKKIKELRTLLCVLRDIYRKRGKVENDSSRIDGWETDYNWGKSSRSAVAYGGVAPEETVDDEEVDDEEVDDDWEDWSLDE